MRIVEEAEFRARIQAASTVTVGVYDSRRWTGRQHRPRLLCVDGRTPHRSITIGPARFCLQIGNYYSRPANLYWALGRKFHATLRPLFPSTERKSDG